MSIKTTLTNPPTIALIALQIIGGLLILASIVGFRSGGMLWPMLGSGAGTCLVEAGGSLTCFAGGNEIMSKYPPGVWEDYAGTLHFDIAALRDETVRGYEVSKGQYVKVEERSSYYLAPDKGANKPYRLLADTMAKTGRRVTNGRHGIKWRGASAEAAKVDHSIERRWTPEKFRCR